MRGLGRIHVATAVALVTYLVALLVPGVGLPTWVVQDLLGNLVLLLPIVILVRRGASHPDERTWTMPLSLGLSLYLGGSVLSLVRGGASTPTFPSPADVGYLGVYPFLLAALLIALRGQVRRVRLVVALDGLCGTLAGAALAAWSIAPLVERMSETSSSPLAALAYPVSGVVVIAVSLGALAAVGLSRGWPFVTWAAGTIAFGVGAIVYSYELAQHSYREGTWLDGLWAVGLVLLAVGATNLRRTTVRVVPAAARWRWSRCPPAAPWWCSPRRRHGTRTRCRRCSPC